MTISIAQIDELLAATAQPMPTLAALIADGFLATDATHEACAALLREEMEAWADTYLALPLASRIVDDTRAKAAKAAAAEAAHQTHRQRIEHEQQQRVADARDRSEYERLFGNYAGVDPTSLS